MSMKASTTSAGSVAARRNAPRARWPSHGWIARAGRAAVPPAGRTSIRSRRHITRRRRARWRTDSMAKLTAKERRALPANEFAGPDRSYPIPNASHARNALSRVSQFGTAEMKAKVREKVHLKFPDIKSDGE